MRTFVAALCLAVLFPASALATVVEKKERDSTKEASTVVSKIDDDRLVESSGLAYSAKFPDLAYTMNDSGNYPTIFAIKVSTGEVVGQTNLPSFDVADTESIYVDPYGHLWLGDLGDNKEDRHDVSIIAFNEPGPGYFELKSALRFPITFRDGPTNVEAMLIHPITGQVYLISKNKSGGNGQLYGVQNPLKNGQPNYATNLNHAMPSFVTDATMTRDGRRALVETDTDVWIVDTETWRPMAKIKAPKLQQGESITIEPGEQSMLLGSEGKKSPLVRMALPPDPRPAPVATATPTSVLQNMAGFEPLPKPKPAPKPISLRFLMAFVVVSGLVVGLGCFIWLRVALRRKRRLRRIRRY